MYAFNITIDRSGGLYKLLYEEFLVLSALRYPFHSSVIAYTMYDVSVMPVKILSSNDKIGI